MKKLILKVFLLIFPVFAVLVFPLIILFLGRELLPIQDVIDRQIAKSKEKKLLLYGTAYSGNISYYKLQSVIKRESEVICLGSSRMLQFRSMFFKNPSTFFNAGLGVESTQSTMGYKDFLEQIPKTKMPKLVIIGLDHKAFHPDCRTRNLVKTVYTDVKIVTMLKSVLFKIYIDYLNDKWPLSVLIKKSNTTDNIGLPAMLYNIGYRNDGSRYDLIKNDISPDKKLAQFEDWREGERADHISVESVNSLNIFLDFCKENGIHVVGFLTPYAHITYSKLISSGEAEYINEIAPVLIPMFKQYGFTFFDFSDLSSFGASDLETLDSSHGSEKAILRMFLMMMKHDTQLRNIAADETFLRKRLNDETSQYYVFRNNEF